MKKWVGSRDRDATPFPDLESKNKFKNNHLKAIHVNEPLSKLYRRCLLITNIIAPNRTHVTIRVDEVC